MTQTTDGPSWTRTAARAGGAGQPGAHQAQPDRAHAERLPVPTRQRRPLLAALALVLVLGGGALAGFLVLNSGHKQTVLVLSADVQRGHRFSPADFHDGELAVTATGFQPVYSTQLPSLISGGYQAATSLRAGWILTRNMIDNTVQVPGPQYASLGLVVPVGQYPAAGIRAGDVVKVLYTPRSSDAGTGTGGVAAAAGHPLPAGTTLIDKAFVKDAMPSPSGDRSGFLLTIIVRNQDLTSGPGTGLAAGGLNGLAVTSAANAVNAISVVKLPDSESYQTGVGQ